jgi:hypothetical protein
MAGVSWQGLVGGVLAGNELKNGREFEKVSVRKKREPKS